MQVHPTNLDWIQKEAERIEKQESSKTFGKLKYYKMKLGDNILRILPAYNTKGFIFKKIVNHWNLPPNNERQPCLCGTWPDKTETCYVCDAINRVLAEFPDVKLGRQEPTANYYVNVIDRNNEDEGVQICRVTEATYNWFVLKIKDEKIPSIESIESGLDVNIIMSKKKRTDGREQTNYSPEFIPGQSPSPLHEDDETLAKWISGIFDLDRVVKYPNDAELNKIHSYANKMQDYYIRKFRQQDNEDETDSTVGTVSSSKQESSGNGNGTKQSTAFSVSAEPDEKPDCFAGNDNPVAHEGDDIPESLKGTFGCDIDLEKCMYCQFDLECMDKKEEKGL